MKQTVEYLMQMIGSEVVAADAPTPPEDTLSDEFLGHLYGLAKSHDLAHIVGASLLRQGIALPETLAQKFQKQQMLAVYRYQQMQYAYAQVCGVLESRKIAYVPLKGSVIRPYYAEPWMRTSCDIDILVHEEDIERAVEALVEELGIDAPPYKNAHDFSLFLPGKVTLELHFKITEKIESMDKVLLQVWNHVYRPDPARSQYLQTNEFLLFHLVAHNAYHFVNGGCGVRPFVDWWLLHRHITYDRRGLDALLEAAGLKTFEGQMTALSEVWFGNAAHTDLTREMEDYVLGGGVYGTLENQVAIASQHSQGKLRYLMLRIFMPYRQLKNLYPRLEKCPVLYPFYTVKRWCRVLFGKNRKKAVHEIKFAASISNDKAERLSAMCRTLELKKE